MSDDLYNPKRQIRIVEQNQKTVILTPDGIATTALAKALKAEANDLMMTKLWPILTESLRADAVRIGIKDYTVPEHAHYAKAIWMVTEMMEGIVEELSKVKIE